MVATKRSLLVVLVSLTITTVVSTKDSCHDPNWHNLETLESARNNCGEYFKGRCFCERICYDGRHRYVVNCTNSGFDSTEPLEHLPETTEVLIFTGNDIEELPWNVFGTLNRLPLLRVIDMSNNNIREIRGKAYHHVKQVERLILDFNKLSLDPARSHPRVFSNFESLLELHLTKAFESGQPRDLAATLHDIFVNSNLTQLMKLHLEQNEISEFRDPNVFCDLPNLLDLYLGNNALTALHFNISCLPKLRFLDLERNKFETVPEDDLRAMDSLVERNQSLIVDFSRNPFNCSCRLNPFIRWMEQTKVFVRNKEQMYCSKDAIHKTDDCSLKLAASSRRGATVVLALLSILLVFLVCALIYVQRVMLQKKIGPMLDFVNKRVRYTTIATGDTREDV